jgi:hypothetical protein
VVQNTDVGRHACHTAKKQAARAGGGQVSDGPREAHRAEKNRVRHKLTAQPINPSMHASHEVSDFDFVWPRSRKLTSYLQRFFTHR